ncbi:MAG: ABC transporter substrate-binding protein [Bacteroidota bacterium]
MKRVKCWLSIPLVLMLLASIGVVSAETQPTGSKPKRVDQVTIAIQAAPDTLNPYNVSGAYGDPINDCIYEKFFDYTYKGEIIPRLCTSYKWTMDDKGHMIITFYMAKNATWHDGEPLTAHDVVFTAQTITNPQVVTTRRYYWSSLVGTDDSGVCKDVSALGIAAVDDYTVQYTLKGPRALDAYFLIDMRFQYILPEHLLKNIDPSQLHKAAYFQHPVGAGPLKFDSMIAGKRYELVCNRNYYRGLPNMDRLNIVVMDPANYAAALASGQIDANTFLSALQVDDWDYVCSLKNIKTKSVTSYTYQWMNINHSRKYLHDARVRQAISFAINRQAIVDQLLGGQGHYAVSSIPPSSRYFNPAYAKDPYDPKTARALLKEAGWDFNRVLDFVVPIGNKVRENSAVLIQQDLAAVGIQTKIRMVDFTTAIVELREGKFDLGLLGGSGPDPDDVRLNFLVNGPNNFSHLDTMEFYNVLDKARSALTFEERRKLYFQWQAMCYKLTPIVWLYHPNILFAYSNKFDNYPCEDSLASNIRVMEWTFK